MQVSLVGVGPVFCVGPFAQGGLYKAFGLAIGLRGVRSGAPMPDVQLLMPQNPFSVPVCIRGRLAVETLGGTDEEDRHAEEGTYGRADHSSAQAV